MLIMIHDVKYLTVVGVRMENQSAKVEQVS